MRALFVAIPGVLGYKALTRANKAIVTSLNRLAHELYAFFVTGSRLSSSKGNWRVATRGQ